MKFWADEKFDKKHTRPGLLSMASASISFSNSVGERPF
jgi:hypothetical protein